MLIHDHQLRKLLKTKCSYFHFCCVLAKIIITQSGLHIICVIWIMDFGLRSIIIERQFFFKWLADLIGRVQCNKLGHIMEWHGIFCISLQVYVQPQFLFSPNGMFSSNLLIDIQDCILRPRQGVEGVCEAHLHQLEANEPCVIGAIQSKIYGNVKC